MWLSIDNTLFTVLGYPLSYIEFVATLTGLLSVWFASRANVWTWPLGLINVAGFFLIFFQISLYADMFLQAYFFFASIYGWLIWRRKRKSGDITLLSQPKRIGVAVCIVLATIICGSIITNIHLLLPTIFHQKASYPFIDSFIAVMSIIATILLAQRVLENWVLWIVIDLFSVVLYYKKMVLFISIEYFLFLIIATYGLFTWLKMVKNEKRLSNR